MAHRVLPLSQPASATYSSRPLPYATKTELVYQHLRHLMVNGALLPGQRIYLDEIAIQLGVSTNPVREALRRLESEGLITNRPHTGACVSVLDIKQIEVHFMIRGVLEGLAMRLAAVRLTASELERLDALHRDLDRLVEAQDFIAWDECNLSFYRLVFDISGSPDLVALIDLQRDRSPRYRNFPDVLKQRAEETIESRRTLLAALRIGDADTAERLHRANVVRVGHLLCSAMQRVGNQPRAADATLGIGGIRG